MGRHAQPPREDHGPTAANNLRMGTPVATRRLVAIAGCVALAALGPLARAQADESDDSPVPGGASVPGDEAIFEGDVGVLLRGPEPEEPAPPTDDEPAPAPQPPPAGENPAPAGGPSSPPPSASTALPKRSASQPAFVAAIRQAPGSAIPSGDDRWAILEQIFLREGRLPTASPDGVLGLQTAKPSVPGSGSSFPSLLMTSLLAMLGALLLAHRQYGPALFAPPARRPAARPAQRRPSAPRGWRVVPVVRDMPASIASPAARSAIEQPVLSAGGLPQDRSAPNG